MKTNFYILLILLLGFSIGNAQSTPLVGEVESNKMISTSNEGEIASVFTEVNIVEDVDSLLIAPSKVNETIARSSSDIRVYLNRKRKVSNINLVFTGINKAAKA